MQNITAKVESFRTAIAQAIVLVSDPKTIAAIVTKTVPKGDVLEVARTAGLFGVKRTSDMIPDCHPLPVEHTEIRFSIDGLAVRIEVEVKTIYKTGVEVEAMHGASVVALTMYDMLKPIDEAIEIQSVKLLRKSGGKKDNAGTYYPDLQTAVIIVSDSVSRGEAKDSSGALIVDCLQRYSGKAPLTKIVSDDEQKIITAVEECIAVGASLIITTGGTGLGPRDKTPDAIASLLETEIPGLMEAIRSYGQDRTPFAMLSRGVAGIYRGALVITLPGSPSGVADSLAVLFPAALHYFQVKDGHKH